MVHTDDHDPILMWEQCPSCNIGLRLAFNKLADLNLGPRDAGALIERIRELAR